MMIIIIIDHSPSRTSQGQFIQIVNKHCKNKNPNWPQAKRSLGVRLGATENKKVSNGVKS